MVKKIPAEKWKSFLNKNFGYPVNDSLIGNAIYYFNQPVRYAFFLSPHFGIPLRDLREEFKLKSTWFSCHLEGTELVLQGKGFGHGVGLCQEGAMRMAQLGFSFEQILKFYFTGVDFLIMLSSVFSIRKFNLITDYKKIIPPKNSAGLFIKMDW